MASPADRAAHIFLCVLLLASFHHVNAQEEAVSSSYGKEFYIGYMSNVGGTSFTSLRLQLSTNALAANFVVESMNGIIQEGMVSFGSPVTVGISFDFQVADSNFENREKGIHIYSTNDEPISVIAENFVFPFNHGVFLAYPCLYFETDSGYEYSVISVDATGSLKSQVLLVGCENDTKIVITPSRDISIPESLQTDSTDMSVDAGSPSNELLINKMQTFLITSEQDLTFTKIVSNKPLTVIAGHECASVPFFSSGCEPLAFQVPPVSTWGTNFFLTAFSGRGIGVQSVFKLLTTSINVTTVSFKCGISTSEPIIRQISGSFEFLSSENCFLQASAPLLVVQLAQSGSIDEIGDPAIALISPTDQYIHEISFLSLPTSSFPFNYINVVVTLEHFSTSSVILDGEVLDCEWVAILNSSNSVVGYACNKTMTSGTSSPEQHNVTHSSENGLMSVLVYGFNRRSKTGYAYLAGQQIFVGDGGGEEIVVEERQFLPFFDIIDLPGMNELERVVDAVSEPIYIPDGLIFGDEVVSRVFINENGVISFKDPWKFSFPNRFPTDFFWTKQGKVIAPFWSDNDIRKEGAVRYATYCNITGRSECSTHEKGQAILDEVNRYIQTTRNDLNELFIGTWILIAFWDHVHPSPHGADDTQGIPEKLLSRTNTYQAIVISDVVRTFAVFTFLCGGVKWSSIGSRDAAVVGYNNAGDRFVNHPLSGYLSIGDAVSCVVGQGKRRKRETNDPDDSICISTNPELADLIDNCIVEPLNVTLGRLSDLLLPCPSTQQAANKDRARFKPQSDSSQCYVSMITVPEEQILVFATFDITQQCCYREDNGALITDPGGDEFAGSMLFQHPLLQSEDYNGSNGDKKYRDTCCDPRLGGEYCHYFFDFRRYSHKKSYTPPALAIGSGDPHYKTFDWTESSWHHYQGTGDFTLMELHSLNQNTFYIQGRLGNLFENEEVSWHVGLAIGESDMAFECHPNFVVAQTKPTNINSPPNIVPDGIGSSWHPQGINKYTVEIIREPDVDINGPRPTLLFLFYKYELSVQVTFFGDHMNYDVRAPQSFLRESILTGFFGNLDGDPTNELVYRGTTRNLSYQFPLHHKYGLQLEKKDLESWRKKEEENLFSSNRKKRQSEIPDPEPDTLRFEDLAFTEEQETACNNNPQCLFDFAVTGRMEVGLQQLAFEEEANKTVEILNNSPPIISASSTLRVTINMKATLYLSVMDPGDNVTLSVQGGLPDTATLEELTEGEFVFQWTLQEVTYEPLTFVANDSKGAASVFSPKLEVCACANGGNCSFDGISSNNVTIVMNCQCTQAFAGRFCEEDRNGCSEIECFEGVECMDVPAPGVGAVCGSCPLGYTGDSKCFDIDECSLNATLCGQLCTNTDGGYTCSCENGYQLIDGSSECEDTNECSGVNDCQQTCSNTVGSYECSCIEGFTLGEGGRNCTADVPCDGACSFGCAVINNEEQCFCPIGLQLDTPGGTNCIDINECEKMSNPCEQLCRNTDGSFECYCKEGYKIQDDEKSCRDIDECFEAAIESLNLCESDPNSQCVNNEGTFNCTCVSGYILNENGTCERIVNEPPPPPPPVIRPASSEDNSVNYTSPILSLSTFTPELKQRFRRVAAEVVNNYCSNFTCELIISDEEKQQVIDLKVDPTNIALPSSLVFEDDYKQLIFTVYVQVGEGFLSKDQLQPALMQAEERFRTAGFQIEVNCNIEFDYGECDRTVLRFFFNPNKGVCEPFIYSGCRGNGNNFESLEECIQRCNPNDCPPFCTVDYCSARRTRTAPCTLQEPSDVQCDSKCRVTYCHTCYYDDGYRPLPGNCKQCTTYVEIEQRSKCFRQWATCTRRADGRLYSKVRPRERTQGRFKCYEHPCV